MALATDVTSRSCLLLVSAAPFRRTIQEATLS